MANARTESGLRLLLVGHLDRLRARLDRNQYYRYEALARQPGVILFGPGEAGYRPGMPVEEAVALVCGGAWPDVIVHGMDFKESGIPILGGLAATSAITALELQDSWAVPERQTAFINEQRFDFGLMIVAHHIPFYRCHCPRTEFMWTPHAINTRLFGDHGRTKDFDVLLYGNTTTHTYPLRARLAELLPRQSDLKVRLIPHPGYYPEGGTDNSHVIAGERLSQEINRAWITVATSSIYKCLMMKYYEIAASRSLIAGDMPEEGRMIFGDNFLELTTEMSDGELLAAIRGTLAEKERLLALTDEAYRRIHRDYSTDAFAERLMGLFQRVKETRDCHTMGTQALLAPSHNG